MKREELLQVYDHHYADTYNERFLTNRFSQLGTDFELQALRKVIGPGTRWLDIGCGTGFFLSQFPAVERAGLDINPVMLQRARAANPNALFFREGDFRNPFPEWRSAWSLISCMWTPYNYVESLPEVERVVQNMVDWTVAGGAIFIPVVDIEDLRPNTLVPYEEKADIYGGSILLTSYTWEWVEHSGAVHRNLIAPHADHFIRLLQPYFDQVELLRYPPFQNGWVSRKAVLATGRRAIADAQRPAQVIRHPIPPPANDSLPDTPPLASATASLSNRALLAEVVGRIRTGRFWRALRKKMVRR
ncbi:class I SAM-dependent methyltransferase [Paraflavisolibacter sp. H34]|uniref:class I SAM-dependent methyltransferase n=1 Tax=Huijunlia imazamoxiresistens TaxID=3127457 RepID=UPI00301B27A1